MADVAREATVLVVDDTPDNIDLLDAALNRDYKIKAALTGEKALKIALSETPPDIILLDIEMPEMNGYEVCRRLKAHAGTRDIPVIFVTARSDFSDEVKGLQIGAVDYIRKPFSPAIVQARVKTQLTLKLMRQRVAEAFGRHVDPSVAEIILNEGVQSGGEMKDVTLLFSDIREFTSFAERNQPRTVFSRINAYYAAMTDIIQAFGGVVLQYVGDEIEAVFGAPVPCDNHPDKAVQAALEMRRGLLKLNARFEDLGEETCHHGIGIHSGSVLAGLVGSLQRQTYSLVGDNVNLASRVSDLCKFYKTDILISQQTCQRLLGNYQLKSLPPASIKGRHQNVLAYEIRS